jgi:hypothetical protein
MTAQPGACAGRNLGLTPPGFKISPRWGSENFNLGLTALLNLGLALAATWGLRHQALRFRPEWGSENFNLGLTALLNLGLTLAATWGLRRQALRFRPEWGWEGGCDCHPALGGRMNPRPGAHAARLQDFDAQGLRRRWRDRQRGRSEPVTSVLVDSVPAHFIMQWFEDATGQPRFVLSFDRFSTFVAR